MLIAHGISSKDAEWLLGVDGPAVAIFTYLGAKHMVTGYDHLLFLAGVIFFLYRLRDVVLYVSLFTVGHSLTLLAGVLGGIHANAHIVDALIGFSVVYKGFENLGGFERVFSRRPNAKVAVTVFGLVHGFGLATKLQDFQLPANGLVINMLSFNAGVEIGQVLALTVLVTLFALWRRRESFVTMTFAANSLLMAAGFVLIGFQVGALAEEGGVVTLPRGASSPLMVQPDRYLSDEVTFTLDPSKFVEYKYRMDKGAPMLYSWRANGELEYDFHTEPQNTESSAVVSFEQGNAAAKLGSYVAPFDGLHGWYWKNNGATPVTITLTSTGFYRGPTEFRMDGSRVPHTLKPAAP
jgi:HupE / UreJ protein